MFYKTIEGDYVARVIRVLPVTLPVKPTIIRHRFDPRPPPSDFSILEAEEYVANMEKSFIRSAVQHVPMLSANITLDTAKKKYHEYARYKLAKDIEKWERTKTQQWKVWLPDGTTAILTKNPLEETL